MVDFKFSCPHCGQHIQCTDAYSGIQINCPACQKVIVVPQAPGASAPAATPPPPPSRIGIQRSAAPAPRSAPAASRAAFKPPAKAGSRVTRNVLISVAVVVLCAGLGVGGWYLYPKVKATLGGGDSAAASQPRQQKPADPAAAKAAEDILAKVTEAYAGLTSFSATGKTAMIVDLSQLNPAGISGAPKGKNAKRRPNPSRNQQTMTSETSVKLSKPDFYRIEWNMNVGPTNVMANAVWSAGKGDFMLSGRQYSPLTNRQAAFLVSLASGGLNTTVAQLFFGETEVLAKAVKNWVKSEDDRLNGEDCYVLSGDLFGLTLHIWVSKASNLIFQTQITLGGQLDLGDLNLEEQMKRMGANLTPQDLASAQAQINQAVAMSSRLKGSITATYDKVDVATTFTADDFTYPVPPGVRLSPSPF